MGGGSLIQADELVQLGPRQAADAPFRPPGELGQPVPRRPVGGQEPVDVHQPALSAPESRKSLEPTRPWSRPRFAPARSGLRQRAWLRYRSQVQVQEPQIVTPEAVGLQFRTAGLGSRSLARLVDTAIQMV